MFEPGTADQNRPASTEASADAPRATPRAVTGGGKGAPSSTGPKTIADIARLARLEDLANSDDTRACELAVKRVFAASADRLARSDVARERLVGAMIDSLRKDDGAGYRRARAHWVARAADQHPDDRLMAWMNAVACTEASDCNEARVIGRLHELDPGNSAPHLLALDAALKRDDLARADSLLQQAARQARVDVYWHGFSQLIVDVIGPVADVPACDRSAAAFAALEEQMGMDMAGTAQEGVTVFAVGVGAAQPVPLFGLARLCPGAGAIASARLPACRAVFAQMASSDVTMLQAMGTRGLARHAATPIERASWRDKARNVEWLMREGYPHVRARHQALMWQHGEVPVLTALLEEKGRWPAPADWRPDR